MAIVIENNYVGDGSTVLYSFTFEYIDAQDVKVSLDGVLTTEWTFANATEVELDSAPANGVAIRIYRSTTVEDTKATFYPGSAIRAQDLNDNFEQILFVVQENTIDAGTANQLSKDAVATANAALSTANTADANAAAAVVTANAADAKADAAVITANNATVDAAAAVVTANAADLKSDQALTAVTEALLYVSVSNVAAIPGSPADGAAIEVTDSTGIESFTPLTGVPAGFVGDSGLSVRILYNGAGSTWAWVSYTPNDPDDRYLSTSGGVLTGALDMGSNLISSVTDPVSAQDAATKNYVDTQDAAQVSQTSDTGSAEVPAGTEAQRDGSPSAGYLRFNTDTDSFEGYDGTDWGNIGGGASAGGAIYENSNSISADYTLTAGTNGMSAGPVTIDSGATVTVPSGSSWVIV